VTLGSFRALHAPPAVMRAPLGPYQAPDSPDVKAARGESTATPRTRLALIVRPGISRQIA
jgi:hypothetical protein